MDEEKRSEAASCVPTQVLHAALLLTLIVLGGSLLVYGGDFLAPQTASILVAAAVCSLIFLYACIAFVCFVRRKRSATR